MWMPSLLSINPTPADAATATATTTATMTSLASDDGGATPIEVGGEGVTRENETTPCWTAMMPSFDLDVGREVAIQQPAGTREMVAQQKRGGDATTNQHKRGATQGMM